uniref:Ig-like domain-containing protein n=1 Tax=Cyprinus carpio carpio TaxID=630221 RepID=A0A9J8B705_CYPCA
MKPGKSHKLTCTASGFDIAGSWMAGIRQKSGNDLELVIKPGGSHRLTCTVHGRFTISRDNRQHLQTEDTAVYYCARRPLYMNYYKHPLHVSTKIQINLIHNYITHVLILQI